MMATGTANLESTGSSSEERFIQQQLDKTRRQVKLVDLFGGLMLLAVAVLGFLLLVAVVDAWLFDLGRWGRVLALVTIVAGGLAYLGIYVVPLVFRKVNPVYAARTIERAQPSLKNGVINFLMFRTEPKQVEKVVYQELEHEAAVGLSHVPIETAVDRSKLIRLGYVLAGVVVVCGVYKVLSPKDPFQSVARVAAPLADISRPTRVQILDVDPGDDITIFYGTRVTVSARIRGLDDGSATLIFSTDDGQQQDQRIPMTISTESERYQCELTTGTIGIEQDVHYRIEAGDAFTRDYRVRVRTAPTIAVESVQYDYPSYANRPTQLIEGQGDVKALEGTRVTVTAVANLPIEMAEIKLRSSSDAGSVDARAPSRGQKSIAMSVKDRKAVGQFFLELRADRETPRFDEYLVSFTTADGYENENPAEYRIEVIPDLAPEVEILTPRRERIEVPANRSQTIEVRALDPDFALRQVSLRAASAGTDLLNAVLLDARAKTAAENSDDENLSDARADRNSVENRGHLGQAVATFEFQPESLKLKPGDEVVFWAVAQDNRTSVRHQLPEPNVTRTSNFYIKITPPETSRGLDTNAESPEEKDEDGSKTEEKREDGSSQSGSEDGGAESTGAGNAEQGDSGQAEKGEASGGSSSGSDSASADASEGGEASGEGTSSPSDGSPSGSSQSTGSESTDQGNSESSPATDSGNGDKSKTPAAQDGAGDSFESDGTNAGEGVGDSEISGKPDLDNASVKRNKDAESQDSESDEPLHEGEVFEKILEHLKNQQKDSSGDGNNSDSKQDATSHRDDRPKNGQPSNTPNVDGATDNADSPQPNDEGAKGDSTKDAATSKGDQASDAGVSPNGEKKGESDGSPTSGDKPDGGESGDPQGPSETRKEDANDKSPSENEGGNGQGETGDAGAGRASDSETGSPQSQGENRDRDKTSQPDSGSEQGEEAKSPSTSNKQSDSMGENAGDRSGGGGEGGGQNANQAGRDTAGSNTSADSGAGASDESGQGETSGRGGDDQTAEKKTGSASEETGNGSSSQSDPKGDTVVKRPGDSRGSEAGNPHGGSGGIGDSTGGTGLGGEIGPGDEAKLEYAEKATDLALDYLRDQEATRDRELLDELGWTEEELKSFIERWSQLKRKAKEGSSADRSELTRSLRSLGLSPGGDRRRASSERNDQFRDLRDEGFRETLPTKYIEQFKAFQRGAARAENSR